jgi:hypothetical protein
MKDIIEAMYHYAQLGLPVFPVCPHNHNGMSNKHKSACNRPGKRPLIKNWQSCGVPSARQIDEWANTWPCFNIGLLLGSPSGIVGIDVDGEGGQRLLRQLSGGELPPTWTFLTPNNGMRYLYRIPNHQVLKKFAVADATQSHCECALLGEGCQTVLPPSIHANGGRYRWITGPLTTNSQQLQSGW